MDFDWDYSAHLHAIPVTSAGKVAGDWVEVGAIKGFAMGPSDPDTNIVVVQIHGGIKNASMVADAAGGGIAEGDHLVWNAAADGGEGAFTDTGASATAYDAVAGLGTVVAQGATSLNAEKVWLGIIPNRP